MTGNDPDGENKRSVRQYTAEYIEAFLDKLTTDYKFEAIYFDDDTFNIGSHTIQISKIAGKYNIPWFAMCKQILVKKKIGK